MTDISGNVEAMSGYTIGNASTDTITDAEYTIFLGWAQTKVSQDGITAQTDQAISLLICHYISRKGGESGKISESIGNYSYTKASNSISSWMDEYNALAESTRVMLYKVNR